ncbi:MAG: M14 family metallopeptidase [Pseudobdellovibrio sp.]
MAKLLALIVLFTFNSAFADNLAYFKNTYEECDKNFNEIFQHVKEQNPKAEIYQFLYPQGNIKTYFIPAKEEQKNLVVLVSGTHGIEAFAGSAVQRYILDQKLDNKTTAYLMVHGFNLWGFKNLRRVNENNIDLNRNFVLDRNHFKPDDSQYALLNTNMLNPETPPSAGVFAHGLFLIKAAYNMAVYGLETLRAAILKGQYTFENGLFYGGKEPQEQELLINQLVTKYFTPYKKIFMIDLHTGYGERAKLHLLAGKQADENSTKLKRVFPESEIDFADKKKFYVIEGEMLTFFGQQAAQIAKADVIGITFEFGTLDSQKTNGSIESLRRMILENQNFHYPAQPEDADKIKEQFREMFYPSDPAWRQAVLEQADARMAQVMKYLNAN